MKRSETKLALLAAVVMSVTAGALADPPVQTDPTDDPIPRVFCFRITDIERVDKPGDPTPDNDFAINFEILNWTNMPAASLHIAYGAGTIGGHSIAGIGVDRDGRGGPLGGNDMDAKGPGLTTGFGTTDAIHFHNGAGSVLRPNAWDPIFHTPTTGFWSSPNPAEHVDFQDLIGVATPPGGVTPAMLIPTPSPDGAGDTSIDGGAGTSALEEDGITPVGAPAGNSLDGLTITFCDVEEGDVIQLNWVLLDDTGTPIGVAGLGNAFGFGTLSIGRVNSDGTHAGPVLWGNTGMNNQQGNLFFDQVFFVPPDTDSAGGGSGIVGGGPAGFVGEAGAGITGPFMNPQDNEFGLPANTNPRDCSRWDPDCDGDTDTVDLTVAIQNFTGAGGIGKFHADGNTDSDIPGDQDVDTVDLTGLIQNFTGALAADPNVPDLIYVASTGEVIIDTEGQDVISFSLQGGPFNTGNTDFSGLPAGLNDNIANQIGWTSFNIGAGLVGVANLGAILPAGLDEAGLLAALGGGANYGLSVVTGGGGRFDIVPEPASLMLMGIGALALVRRRRAA